MPTQITTEIERAFVRTGVNERKDLAKVLDISPQYISGLMMGHRKFTPKLIAKIIRILNVPPETAKRWHRACARADGWRI